MKKEKKKKEKKGIQSLVFCILSCLWCEKSFSPSTNTG